MALAVGHCGFTFAAGPSTAVTADDPGAKFVVGHLDQAIPESSGIVASRKHPGVFWTLNDSGNLPQVFAIDRAGKTLATYAVGVKNVDWEDIAIDDGGHLYISETGNNARRRDRSPVVYRIDEPNPARPVPAEPLKVTVRFPFRYPKDPFDCEGLFVWKDHAYVVSKHRDGTNAQVFRFLLIERPMPPVLEPVAILPLRAPVTGADMSADGKELLVLTVLGPSRFVVNGDPARAATVTPRSVTFLQPDMEGATLVPEGVIATTESGFVLLFSNESFGEPKAAAPVPAARVSIARATKPIVVDGVLDDWEAVSRQPLKAEPADAPDAAKAELFNAWTPEGIYVAARVPRGDPRPLVAEWFTGDVVEIFIGRESDARGADYGAGDDRCYVGFVAAPDGARGNVVLNWPRRPAPPTSATASGRVNEDGSYQLEAFLPAAAFGSAQPLAADGVIRLNVSILARKPRCNWYVSEPNSTGTWMSPLKWAIATLK